jgi:hypothetical protein
LVAKVISTPSSDTEKRSAYLPALLLKRWSQACHRIADEPMISKVVPVLAVAVIGGGGVMVSGV